MGFRKIASKVSSESGGEEDRQASSELHTLYSGRSLARAVTPPMLLSDGAGCSAKRKLRGSSSGGNAAADQGPAYTAVAFFLRRASTTSRLNFGFSHFVMFVTYLVSALVGVLVGVVWRNDWCWSQRTVSLVCWLVAWWVIQFVRPSIYPVCRPTRPLIRLSVRSLARWLTGSRMVERAGGWMGGWAGVPLPYL